jgi:WD40 repeat protein
VAFDGKLFAVSTGTSEGGVRVFDVAQGQELGVIHGFPGHVQSSLAFAPDGKRLISAMDDTTGLVWDLSTVWDLPKKR